MAAVFRFHGYATALLPPQGFNAVSGGLVWLHTALCNNETGDSVSIRKEVGRLNSLSCIKKKIWQR